eukprot:CAMPEP_0114416162 /NCGR_PEP_ID=MMETSP0103-20121206/2290_1 /TAXON_ID=37642 ORGANISM="Paraphysomonas imperforata, Strain PA2" /NCGR_SAMPLE_ID=MMETSP0103 /ASSEMBLY_ACC=CAM_ASM_000201 /LENGTH=617 /DNA_ID=CAMNT_0001584383 /DNA_START=153 /DNA_END=2003 /DNA_ORIENTATION=-
MIQQDTDVSGGGDVHSPSEALQNVMEGSDDMDTGGGGIGSYLNADVVVLEDTTHYSDSFGDEVNVLLSIEEDSNEQFTLPEEGFLDRHGLLLIGCCATFLLCVAVFAMVKGNRQRRVGDSSRHSGHGEMQLVDNNLDVPRVSVWHDEAHSREVLSDVAAACLESARVMVSTAGGQETSTPQLVASAKAIEVGHALFDSIFVEGDVEAVGSLQGVVPTDVEQQLFHANFLLCTARARLDVRVAHNVSEQFKRTERNILLNLSSAIALENTSDAHYGTMLCRLMDGRYGHMQLQRSPIFLAAQQLLDDRVIAEERRALDETNLTTERLLSQYQQSFVALAAHQQTGTSSSVISTGHHITSSSHKMSSITVGGDQVLQSAEELCESSADGMNLHVAHHLAVASQSSAVSQAAASVELMDSSQQLSMLNHVNTIRADSDRSLMQRLDALRVAHAQAKDAAGARATLSLQQFADSVDIDQLRRAETSALNAEADLVTQRDQLLLLRQQQKIKQNTLHKWFSYMLLLCGAFLFCNGAVGMHGGSSAEGTAVETSMLDWAMFQLRMICVHMNEDNEECSLKEDFLEYDFTLKNSVPTIFSSLFTQEALSWQVPRVWSGVKGFLW